MNVDSSRIELLAPAKNADFGIAAIDHGADAVYIGGPSFGARANAGNAVADIARLANYAHRFNAASSWHSTPCLGTTNWKKRSDWSGRFTKPAPTP